MARIEHFAIYAGDPTALKDFYVRALGLQLIVESGGDSPAYFLADDRGIAIEVVGRPTSEHGANQRWLCHLAFLVDDVPAERAALESLGVVFEADTGVDTDELKTAFFTDPGGNRCQLVWRRRRLGT
jgi:glyoxylase I family protein